jgi:RNA polymerase sigma-70 factor, ECF subfamily
MMEFGIHIRRTEINGQPGAIFLDALGRLTNVFALDIPDGVVQTIRSIINPDRLGHLGPVADVRRLMRGRRAP